MDVPRRYDLPNVNSVNHSISILNKKIKKLTKAFPHANVIETDDNRNLFTNHRLDRNKLVKRLPIHLLASFAQSLFEQKALSPIILDWQNVLQENGNLECEVQEGKNSIRNSSRNKKYLLLELGIFYG
jgi:hypothetical protein